jgi:hypothetical protein
VSNVLRRLPIAVLQEHIQLPHHLGVHEGTLVARHQLLSSNDEVPVESIADVKLNGKRHEREAVLQLV